MYFFLTILKAECLHVNQSLFQILTIYSDDFNLELSAWLTYHLGYLGLTQTQGAKDFILHLSTNIHDYWTNPYHL